MTPEKFIVDQDCQCDNKIVVVTVDIVMASLNIVMVTINMTFYLNYFLMTNLCYRNVTFM